MAINRMIEQDFKSGIHSQIMGSGKSYIILNSIQKHYEIKRENCIYIIMTERIEILSKLFLQDSDKKLNKINCKKWKELGIINMELFEFQENLVNKNFKIIEPKNKPILWVINNAFLKKHYKKIDRDKMGTVNVDECQSISGIKNYEMLKWLKYNNDSITPIIGYSATPLRPTKNVNQYIRDIYSIHNNKLNIISNYTLIDALQDDIVLPFKHIIIEPEIIQDKSEYIKNILEKYIDNNDDLPYKKGVGWTNRIINLQDKPDNKPDNIYDIFKKYNKNIYRNHSKMDKDEFNKFCELESDCLLLCVNCCKEGSDIKNLDYAIYLDGVKKRSLLVALQTSGRVMRIDEKRLKKHALILEVLQLNEREKEENNKIEFLTINKLLNYYKSILNLSEQENILEYNNNIINKFIELYENTYIKESKHEIQINLVSNNTNPCIIKLDIKTIDWNLLKQYLHDTINNIKLNNNNIIKIKELMLLKLDDKHDFNKIYNEIKLELQEYEINIIENILKNKSWYDILEINHYYDFDNFINILKTEKRLFKYSEIWFNLDLNTLNKFTLFNNNIPPNSKECYRLYLHNKS
jgi:hypothetical protein